MLPLFVMVLGHSGPFLQPLQLEFPPCFLKKHIPVFYFIYYKKYIVISPPVLWNYFNSSAVQTSSDWQTHFKGSCDQKNKKKMSGQSYPNYQNGFDLNNYFQDLCNLTTNFIFFIWDMWELCIDYQSDSSFKEAFCHCYSEIGPEPGFHDAAKIGEWQKALAKCMNGYYDNGSPGAESALLVEKPWKNDNYPKGHDERSELTIAILCALIIFVVMFLVGVVAKFVWHHYRIKGYETVPFKTLSKSYGTTRVQHV
ncbi:hypothetical protein RFI_02001 [Reticulomyxa filosa]|uniref:Uncharacterized protein n=1 Tax=Reticulomyxa filosa TaxID=46433 RepID=X6PBL5_RETFI|nr:hypothetical protein RFI_02001 [Reticulomyxa filosa]|eukprot:ETO35072.1 hypothetical protein RFI_02001 [Reticulomyxa filosa]